MTSSASPDNSAQLFSLHGKVALVTGASRGLGWAIAGALAGAGAHVILNGRVESTLTPRAEQLADCGLRATVAAFDVTDEPAVRVTIDRIVHDHEHLDILVNNAGTVHRAVLAEARTPDWQRVLDLNVTAAFVLAREAARFMVAQKWGRIINVGSVMSVIARETAPSYIASKHALAGLTKSLAVELGPLGVTANAIAPGFFATEFNLSIQQNEEFSNRVKTRTPLRRWGRPDEVGGVAVFLASEASSYVNGHVLLVDGGLTISF